jgi:hypothetical protein
MFPLCASKNILVSAAWRQINDFDKKQRTTVWRALDCAPQIAHMKETRNAYIILV